MDIWKVAVFSMLFIVLATFIVGGLAFSGMSYAIPYRYSAPLQMEYPTTACTPVYVEQGPDCLNSGMRACKMLNSGHCYNQCARDVTITCSMSAWNTVGNRAKIPRYSLPEGFEDAFLDSVSCQSYAFDKCREMTSTYLDFKDCYMRAQLPCSELGRLKV